MRDGYRKLQEAIAADRLKPGALRFDLQKLDYIRYADNEIVFEFISSNICIPYEDLTREEALFALKYYVDHFEAKEDEGKSPLDPRPWKEPSWQLKINYAFGLLPGVLMLAVFGILVLNALFASPHPAVHNPINIPIINHSTLDDAASIASKDPRIQDLFKQNYINSRTGITNIGSSPDYPCVAKNLTEVTFSVMILRNEPKNYKVYVDVDNASVAGVLRYNISSNVYEPV